MWQKFKAWRERKIKDFKTWKAMRKYGGTPRTFDEAMEALALMLPADQAKEWVAMDEQRAMSNAHFGIGMWIRNNWKLWKGGKLADWFKSVGIHHADDMSGILLKSFHRKLNNRPNNINAEIKYYREYWKSKGVDPDTMEEAKP